MVFRCRFIVNQFVVSVLIELLALLYGRVKCSQRIYKLGSFRFSRKTPQIIISVSN